QGLAADIGKGIIALGVIVLLSVVGVLFPVTNEITRPLEEITAKADAVAAGGQDIGFEENAHTAAINEVARLRSSLKKMMDGLGQVNALKMAAMTAEFERGRLKAETVAKTQFFASMSHEIRTPMNAITGLSELLLREKLSEPQQEKVRSIKTSCAGLLRTVSDLLDFSNMESGKFELHPAHYSFPQCIDRITSLVDMLARDKGLAFIVETRGHIPRCLFGDAGRLSQLLANILENAVKYTDSGFVRLTVAVEGETLAYTVEDSGAGIKDTVLPYIFDPYSHFGDDTMKQIAGTGLGLSIAKRLALMMGGDIAVSSVVGKGSVFVVRLPLVPGDLEILERDIRETPVSRTWQARALVVDDHPVNLNVAKGLLSLYGLDCDTALSGAEALIRARQQEYDIIFMDHMMPEMDGVEATAAIRALGGRYAVLPVIALTANIIPGAKEALLASGLNDYLPKPVELPALRAILSRWLPPDREGGAPGYGNSAVGGAIPRGETGALIQSAREIAGLDVTTGLSRVCGLEDVFLKSLRLCAESLCQPLARLPGLAAAWDTAALCREMHGLKGSLANIGAMDLAEEAVALEDAARNMNADYYAGRFTDFHRRLGGFAGELRALFFGAAGVRPPGDAGMREDKETELAAALEAYDSDAALAILEELGAFSFGPEHDARLAAVKSRVERFSYDEALETLTRPQGLAPEEGER
ncbi:MAG: response regulator, partial [Deltaproteobacteria bacterium]|nr:response regulator [Deltaproteobacteria bacterium]